MAFQIAHAVARQIAEEASTAAPEETCGLLAGREQHISLYLPVRNRAPLPQREFQLDPAEQLKALKHIDALQLRWLGVCHSHPLSPPIPSEADIAPPIAEDLVHLIVSLEKGTPRFKLWRIERASVYPLELVFDTECAKERDYPLTRPQQAAIVAVAFAAALLLLLIAFALLPPAPNLSP